MNLNIYNLFKENISYQDKEGSLVLPKKTKRVCIKSKTRIRYKQVVNFLTKDSLCNQTDYHS